MRIFTDISYEEIANTFQIPLDYVEEVPEFHYIYGFVLGGLVIGGVGGFLMTIFIDATIGFIYDKLLK